ncbi:MAG: ParB/RepB/Spo0J family partition protein [Deltaproteobacteria bacterium]|nr:ParB/RepB/Spo0J family partition protein [Deltaproteobacteria bacterium]
MSQKNSKKSPQNAKRNNLGRGLSALIPPKPAAQALAPSALPAEGLMELNIEDVLPSDGQPRQIFEETALEELAQSIATHGLLQPIVVRNRGKQFEIVAGERRWRASKKAGKKNIRALLLDIAEKDTLTVALVENVQRQDLNAIEESEAYFRLHHELGYSQGEIAKAVGKDRATIANSLRLLKLPKEVRSQVLDQQLSMGHARALLGLKEEVAIISAADRVIEEGFSVRQTESMVQESRVPSPDDAKGKTKKTKGPAKKETEAERDVRMRLQRALSTKVDLVHKNGKGHFLVHFDSFEQLDYLLEKCGA